MASNENNKSDQQNSRINDCQFDCNGDCQCNSGRNGDSNDVDINGDSFLSSVESDGNVHEDMTCTTLLTPEKQRFTEQTDNEDLNGDRPGGDNDAVKTIIRDDGSDDEAGCKENFDLNMIQIESKPIQTPMSKFNVYKNLFVLCFVYVLLFSAFNAFTNIQSTLYSTDSLGVIGMAILYIVFSAATLFATVYTTSRFSFKWLSVVSMVPYALYICAGFYPTLATVIVASVLIGLAAANLWVVQHAYMTELAKMYASITNRKLEDITNVFFGIFYGTFHTTQIWGNLVSSLVLKPDQGLNNYTASPDICGASYCPGILNMTQIEAPSQDQVYTFVGTCVGLSIISIIMTGLFLSDVKPSSTSSLTLSELLKSVLNHIIHSTDQKLLLIPTIYRGLAPGFILADFTVAFVSCPLGVNYVGFVMIAYGVSSAVLSFVFGKLLKYTGHLPLFVLALVSQGASALTMLLWKPDHNHPGIIFMLASVWAIGHAAYLLQTSSQYSTIFKGNAAPPAFSTCRLMDSVGWAVSLVLSSWMCLQAKLIVMLGTMTVSFITMVVLIKRHRNK